MCQLTGKSAESNAHCHSYIAANRASAVDQLIIIGARRLLYITHRTLQPYHWLSCKLWNNIECSRFVLNLNTMVLYKREAFRTLSCDVHVVLLAVFVGLHRTDENNTRRNIGKGPFLTNTQNQRAKCVRERYCVNNEIQYLPGG